MSTSEIPAAGGAGPPRVTPQTLADKRRRGEPIVMLTAYDFPGAAQADAAGVDAILVGDSLAMVVLGYEDTLAVTMDDMLHHARAVRRGAVRPLLIGDMPFMSYQAEVSEAVRNAGRFLQEGGMGAVKLEGGRVVEPQVRAIVRAGIPVMGHVGLTPQSVRALGGFKVQGRRQETAVRILEDALCLEAAGCFALVLESIPARLAAYLTQRLSIPTIGIGAGAGVAGQVLVYHDVLGLFERFTPRFVKRYAELGRASRQALTTFVEETRNGVFPASEHTFGMSDGSWSAFLAEAESTAGEAGSGPRALAPFARAGEA